ncbi:pyridoxamine 5'-phosphate oxidase family protein [Desulfovibrio falkowii]|uniref:Pyridoxamine 5'-phosphate oxidase family protein n=1 Tax=Desulfovibrio falkowii TaxID=3136602 RepID=A0ABQ0EAP7_9BACT
MRKKNRECNDPAFFDEVFAAADEIFLAMHDGDYPYVLPLNFARLGQVIYIHCALEGHKLDCIRQNPRVAFTIIADVTIHREKSTTYFKSLCGKGLARIVEDEAEKGRALDAIAVRYAALCPQPAPSASIRRTGIVRIDIEELVGKRRQPSDAA